ncbi:hypothetical protein ACI79G_00835 [Geodermatophilus sp. SYSU D00779]
MPTIDPVDAAACATCGRRWTDVDGGRNWLHLEVTRHDRGDGLDFLDADFCSQQHAAEWLHRPLPDPVPPTPYEMTSSDRLASTAVGLSFGLVVALAVLGLWTFLRFIIGQI